MNVSQLLLALEPCWTKKKLIQDITEAALSEQETPEILKNITDFTALSSKLPATCVKNNLRNVLVVIFPEDSSIIKLLILNM